MFAMLSGGYGRAEMERIRKNLRLCVKSMKLVRHAPSVKAHKI